MLEDVSCGYWGCGGVVIRVQGNIVSDIWPVVFELLLEQYARGLDYCRK